MSLKDKLKELGLWLGVIGMIAGGLLVLAIIQMAILYAEEH